MATGTRAADKEARMERCRNIMANEQQLVSYSWEEFVARLMQLDDPRLQKIGQQEMARLSATEGSRHR